MRIEDLFRKWFDQLQVAESVKDADKSESWHHREVFVHEIAPMLPALTAITDDPHLNERFWMDRKSTRIQLAVHGAWNMQ